MTGRLESQHILVTGGANGIGAAIVDKALAEGARVSVFDIDAAEGQRRAVQLPADRTCFAAVDICSADAIAAGLSQATRHLGPVTGLVNNAGRDSASDPVTMTEAEWDDVFSVDLKSAWLMARAVLPAMIAAERGSIVNIASIHARLTYPGSFPYAAAKAGLVGLTRSLALEVGPRGIRVNAVSPGYIETTLTAEFFAGASPDRRAEVEAVHPLRRLGTPADVAGCVAFLLSAEAAFVTGADWAVDGGLSARFAG